MELLQLQRHKDIQQTQHISIQLQNLAFAKRLPKCWLIIYEVGRNNTELQQLQRTTPPKPTPAV